MSKLSAFVCMAMGIVEKTALRMYGLQQVSTKEIKIA